MYPWGQSQMKPDLLSPRQVPPFVQKALEDMLPSFPSQKCVASCSQYNPSYIPGTVDASQSQKKFYECGIERGRGRRMSIQIMESGDVRAAPTARQNNNEDLPPRHPPSRRRATSSRICDHRRRWWCWHRPSSWLAAASPSFAVWSLLRSFERGMSPKELENFGVNENPPKGRGKGVRTQKELRTY